MNKEPKIYFTRMNCVSAFCEINKNSHNYRCVHCEEYYKKHTNHNDDEIPDTHHGQSGPHHWS